MTHIVLPSKYPSKKKFKEAVLNNPDTVYLEDPSVFDPVSGSVTEVMKKKNNVTVTNHPKRSWFAALKVAKGGKNKGKIVAT